MLQKIIVELAEDLLDEVAVLISKDIVSIVDLILNNAVLKNLNRVVFANFMVVLVLVTIIKLIQIKLGNVELEEIKNVVIKFMLLSLSAIFITDVFSITLKFVITTASNFVAKSMVHATFDLTSSIVGGGIMMPVALIVSIILFIKFIFDIAKYTLSGYIITLLYPLYAVECMFGGFTEIMEYFFQFLKIAISVFLLALFVSIGLVLVFKATSFQGGGFMTLVVGIVFMSSKNVLDKNLGKLGMFHSGGGMTGALSGASHSVMMIQNSMRMLGR